MTFSTTFKLQWNCFILTVDRSLAAKTEEYLLKNGCVIKEAFDDDITSVEFSMSEMPHKMALSHCKRFNISILDYYKFKLDDQEDMEVMEAIWKEIGWSPDETEETESYEGCLDVCAKHLMSIGYEFKSPESIVVPHVLSIKEEKALRNKMVMVADVVPHVLSIKEEKALRNKMVADSEA